MEKKFTKLTIFLLLVLIIVCILSLLLFDLNENRAFAEEKDNYAFTAYQRNVNKSVVLYQEIIKDYIVDKFAFNDREIIIYSDNFSCAYIDENGVLNFGLTFDISDLKTINAKPQYSDFIIYRKFTYTYNFLQKIMLEVEKIMLKYNILAVGIDDEKNCVFIEIRNNENTEKIINYLQIKNLYERKAINFLIDSKASIETNSTAYGGESIFYYNTETTLSRGTICVNVIDNTTGEYGVLTNEHVACVNSGNPSMLYGGHYTAITSDSGYFSDIETIGNGARGQRGGSVDAAFVPFESQPDWGISNLGKYNTTTYQNVKLGNESQIISGNAVMRIGQTTGVTTGTIKNANVSISIDGINITNCFRYSNDGQGGDSGGPVYYNDGVNRYLIGAHFASGSIFLGGRQGYACRMSNIMTALNVTPITNDFMITSDLPANAIQIISVGYSINGKFTVPNQINERNVTAIGIRAFQNQMEMTEIVVPSSLTAIGNRAFQNCMNLTTVDLSETLLSSIEDYTFDSCPLGHFEFPNYVTYIGEGAFMRTGNVGTLPNTVTTIGDYSFAYRTSALGIYFPDNLYSIGSYSFAYSEGFIINYSDNVGLTIIGSYAFYNTNLAFNKKIPESVTTIGESAFRNSGFSNNFALASGGQLSSVGHNAFRNCGLKKIVLPTSISTIGNYAFADNDELTIYTEYTSKPTGWSSTWNSSSRPVFWECILSTDKTYVESFKKKAGNPSNPTAINGITNPSRSEYNFGGWYTSSDFSGTQYTSETIGDAPNNTWLYAKWTSSSCIAAGSLITLADGSQVAVENLTGNENLLVWNMLTGQYDTAPILFIDSDPLSSYEIIKLTFSDNTEVKVIYEHAFFDMTIGEYVFMRNDASQYIGHYFNKQGINDTYTTVQLINVTVYNETTTAWSPVTYGHLCYYVNGMLSMPGGTEGLINIFDVDTSLMQYDEEQMEEDILTYGLYTYEEFNAIIPLPEYVFDAFNGQYLKVSIGKGLITLDEIAALLERYAAFFE